MVEEEIPKGRLGNLNEEQERILTQVRDHLRENNQLRKIYDDWTLVRFCRARKWKYDDIMKMLQNNIKYYEEYNIWQY